MGGTNGRKSLWEPSISKAFDADADAVILAGDSTETLWEP